MEQIQVDVHSRVCGDLGGHKYKTLETLDLHPSLVPSIGDQLWLGSGLLSFVVVARRYKADFIPGVTSGQTRVTQIQLIVERCAALYATGEAENPGTEEPTSEGT